MTINTENLTESQQKLLFDITTFVNNNNRMPRAAELSERYGSLSLDALRARIRRLKERNFFIKEDGRDVLNEEELVTWKWTAQIIIRAGDEKVGKESLIKNVLEDKEIEIQGGKTLKSLIERLIKDGYLKEHKGPPDYISVGPITSDLSIYLELLSKKG